MTTQNRMFKITPPIWRKCCKTVAFLAAGTLLVACTAKTPSKAPADDEPRQTEVSRALYHNPDSLLYYAQRAYLNDDPQGLFVTGAAAYLRAQDPDFPDSCTTVPLSEARIMLLRAAEFGHTDAQNLILCLQEHNGWE